MEKLSCTHPETYAPNCLHADDEHIKQIIKRHENYYWVARRLRECVECFGMEIYNERNGKHIESIKIYHGASKNFMFKSLNAYIKGPCSTSRSYSVAQNFSGSDGIILELSIDPKSWTIKFDEGIDALQRISCFDCVPVSDFMDCECW